MSDAPVLGAAGGATVALDDTAFGAGFNGPLLHESVRAELAARRRGTAATKTRGLVSGGNSKPWRQKGTGRARAGSTRAPNFTGGGTVFGPHPRRYTFKVNRKERRAALRSALSLHAQRGSIAIVDPKAFDEPSTKAAASLLAVWGQPGATLVVVRAEERETALSFRNLARVSVLTPSSVGIADIVGAASLLCSAAALEELTVRALGKRCGGGGRGVMDPSQVIIRPVVSEKSYVLASAGKYTFRVHPDAHKTQIRQAVEALFDVHVAEVRTISVKSKPKRRGTTRGRTRTWKKAIVQVRPGETIPIFIGLEGAAS